MRETILAATLLGLIASCAMLQETVPETCRATTVCKLSEAATDKVFDCMKRGPEDTGDACIKAHESTCVREPGFVCGGDQPLPCTLAFAEQEVAACTP